MASSLGIFIEKDIIKYAKLQKEKDSIKVESFSVEFYDRDNVSGAVKKIITETNCSKASININVSNELYNYFETFSMLSKKDMYDSINIEFDLLCGEKGYSRKALETRHILTTSRENADKYKVLHIAANKNDINKRVKDFAPNRVASMTPISTSITNLIDADENANAIIVNIENETQITTIIDGQIYRTDIIQDGMGKILAKINEVESSTKKSYEVCKNITVYSQTQGATLDGNEYLDQITPILDKIINETKEILESSFANIKKIYITGSGTIINNIDLYFQEYITNASCEVLRPYFIQAGSLKIPVKEYIEVNSAIALALNGLGLLNKELNFLARQDNAQLEDAKSMFKSKFDALNSKFKGSGAEDNGITVISTSEKLMIRISVLILVAYLVYSYASAKTLEDINAKKAEINAAIAASQTQISLIQSDKSKIDTATSTYSMLLDSLTKLSNDVGGNESSRVIEKDAIPNLLNKIMFVMPQKVKVNSIENTEGKHIVIELEATEYEQLGYFMAAIKTSEVLTNVKSTSGSKEGSVVKIVIEGDLP